MSQAIKCISIWQPWASLCVIPHPRNPWGSVKRYETRSWPTPYRGPLLIHAAKRFTRDQKACCLEEPIRSVLATRYKTFDDLPTGAIIGRVDLVDCLPSHIAAANLDEYAEAMGDYRPGRFAWDIVRPVMFTQPISYRGQQGLFDVQHPSEV